MANALVIGCGDLGGEVARLLANTGYNVTGVRASNKPTPTQVNCIQADVTNKSSLTPITHLNPDILIYCVAANARTDDGYRSHYVEGLENVLMAQAKNTQLKHVFFVSSTRVYGQQTTAVLDELTPAIPNDFGGERLLEAEQLLNTVACGRTAIRLSGIYGPGRQYLLKLAQAPERWPQSDKWTNRIHRDDAARFISFLCDKVSANQVVEDCYIGVDDMPTLQYDVLTWLAAKLGVSAPQVDLGGKVNGKRLSNQRMRESGFELKYANYQVGYSEMLNYV